MQLPRIAGFRRSLNRRLKPTQAPDPYKNAIVFAPHQDDEVLGCGGAILQKNAVETPVHLVFMTDGSTSHRRFIDGDVLRIYREKEALGAAGVLGLQPGAVNFLRFPDGKLKDHHSAAVAEVRARLLVHRSAEVFVPYEYDGTPDHEATYSIVSEALQCIDFDVRLFEYPIWFWNQWPWVSVPIHPTREFVSNLHRSLRFGMGTTAFRRFTAGTKISRNLDKKRSALSAHRSQMERLHNESTWPILEDVSEGQFLECLLDDYEIFRVTHVPAHSSLT